ncbi:MBL fold metallo-hydrolase [Sorangium sp. So ce1389]|uniref:MBL fold metallo-hydrolase n=1 Tax=Sorangium sp. So ce1389 TaxID=3133336 RepID=UPI003F643CD1
MRKTNIALLGILGFLTGCGAPPPPAPPPAPAPVPPSPTVSASAAPAPPATSASPAASASAAPPPAADDQFAKVEIKAEKVAGAVYMLEGSGGNIAVSVGDDGIVIVDDQFAPLAPKIKAALKGITDRPVRFVLNTHWHFDHTGGNAIFGAGAPIVAHENVRKRLVSGGPKATVGDKTIDAIPPAPKEALPVLTFQDKVSIHLNGEEIRAIHIPTGHTDGDTVVYFTKSNVVHMGDDFVTYGFPFVDLVSGGSVKGLIAAIDRMVKELPADVKVIPGHGKVSGVEDMKKLSATLKDCVRLIEAEVKKKRTLKQIQDAKVLAKYDELGKGFVSADAFAEFVFKELTHQQNVFVPH